MSGDSKGKSIKVSMLTKEWPPAIYGGAGVHVTNLVAALGEISNVSTDVHCFGDQRNDAHGYQLNKPYSNINPALQALLIDADMALNLAGSSIAHSHTWYANFAGYLAAKMHRIPHVITAHSLEPLRPWKAEQLGGGYIISSWVEKLCYNDASAIIAVSDGMRKDVISCYPELDPAKVVTIRNGIDTEKFAPNHNASISKKYGISSPYAIFVGRITRQKGLAHLLRAWQNVPAEYSLVLAAGSPDEAAIGAEVEQLITELQSSRPNIIWIKEMLNHDELTALLTGARAFICPSIYEPLGIVNLEAMACETAVIASAVGGIPEVVADGATGVLVD
ncbi:MAG: glycogen synthase, partial [Actinobacteria bacterium]|nr:glycogen synthase [Actinomycetota bacterium]